MFSGDPGQLSLLNDEMEDLTLLVQYYKPFYICNDDLSSSK
jgi:hypothetical protein